MDLKPCQIVAVGDAYKNPACELNGKHVLLLRPLGTSDWYVSRDLTRTEADGTSDWDYIVHVQRLDPDHPSYTPHRRTA